MRLTFLPSRQWQKNCTVLFLIHNFVYLVYTYNQLRCFSICLPAQLATRRALNDVIKLCFAWMAQNLLPTNVVVQYFWPPLYIQAVLVFYKRVPLHRVPLLYHIWKIITRLWSFYLRHIFHLRHTCFRVCLRDIIHSVLIEWECICAIKVILAWDHPLIK